jgi:phosphonate transport system ATP-binding protein
MPAVATPPALPAIVATTMATTTAPVTLEVDELEKRHPGAPGPVFSGVGFRVAAGERVAIIGANGAGKSTLLRCCLRLLDPDRGRVVLLGHDLSTCRRGELRRVRAEVGMVFQKHNLVPRLSVLSNVLHGALARRAGPRCWFQGLARHEDRAYALHCLEQVGLADLADRRADRLSGGQSQRVAIARALMQRPRALFADEPAASLDPKAGEEVMALFADLAVRQGLTLVFVSHHLDHALTYADRILGLRNGTLALDSTPARENGGTLREVFG